jgi:hypothetical protein
MPHFWLARDRMALRNLAETGSGVGQQRVLVGLQGQTIIAPALGNFCNRAAIAVQRVRRHDLALQRD